MIDELSYQELSHEELALRARARSVADGIAELARQADAAPPYADPWLRAIRALRAEGWLSLLIPGRLETHTWNLMSLVLVQEQLARVDGGLANCVSHEACSAVAIGMGSPDVRDEYLERMRQGSLTCIAISEPDAGSDIGAMSTRATRVSGGYRLSGDKAFASLAGVADILLIWAKTDPDTGSRGVSAFLTSMKQTGIRVGEVLETLGFRQLPNHHVRLDGVQLRDDALLGTEGEGLRLFAQALNVGRLGVAAQGLGLALGAYEKALLFAGRRTTFGKPLVEHQAIQFKLADMFIGIESTRAFLYRVTRFMDGSKDLGAKEVGLYAAAVKVAASDLAQRVTQEAIQILGGRGLWKANDIERLFRDAKVTQIIDGTNELMRMRVGDVLARGSP